MGNHEPGTVKENFTTLDIIIRKISQLPDPERNLLEHGSTYVGINTSELTILLEFNSLIGNSLLLCVINLTHVPIAAG